MRNFSSLRGRGTFGHCPKSTQKDNLKPRFQDFLRADSAANLWPFTTRSREMFDFVAYDASTFFLRRCRSCEATVGDESLYACRQGGQGRPPLQAYNIPVRSSAGRRGRRPLRMCNVPIRSSDGRGRTPPLQANRGIFCYHSSVICFSSLSSGFTSAPAAGMVRVR